MPLKIKDHLL